MSPIPYGDIRGNITARKLVRSLERDGFELERSKGSHHHYKHADGRRVTVTYHRSGDTFTTKTLKNMIEHQAKWDEDDLKRLKLLK